MIGAPRTSVPIPDAVASFSAAQWTDQRRADVTTAGDACRRYTSVELSGPQYVEARWLLAQDIAVISKRLAAYNPRLVRGWNSMPERYERGPQ
ncbi:hypothetical protein ACIRLA_22015 [Streptomyces sp. NPDC102364]|uniref:hypothetical protein n=1 Tax=Streptomyces sp. NPDC102364 TaxID=3366161 RepID=UPI0037F55D22